jgi:hypothetical protein
MTNTAVSSTDYIALDRALSKRPVSPFASRLNLVMMPLAVLLAVLVAADIRGDLRVWLTVIVFVLGPGSGLVQFFRIPDAVFQLALIIAISVALDMVVGQTLLWIDNLDAGLGVMLLAILTYVRPIPRREETAATGIAQTDSEPVVIDATSPPPASAGASEGNETSS